MRVVFGLVLVVGLALAGFAVMKVQEYIGGYKAALAQERANQPKAVPTVEVFVAKEKLEYGAVLEKEHVRKVAWPKAAIPEGAFLAEDATLFADDARYVLRTMEKDEAILAVKVTEPGEDAGLISRLGGGMRAFAINVDVTTGVSGFLRPGDRVDVYWTGRVDDYEGRRGGVTKLIEQGVSIIAVDQEANSDQRGASVARTITVRVDPRQVAALTQAQSSGKLTLSLVGHGDDSPIEAVSVDQTALLGLTREEPKEVEIEQKPEICTVRTRKGAEVVEMEIPCTN